MVLNISKLALEGPINFNNPLSGILETSNFQSLPFIPIPNLVFDDLLLHSSKTILLLPTVILKLGERKNDLNALALSTNTDWAPQEPGR